MHMRIHQALCSMRTALRPTLSVQATTASAPMQCELPQCALCKVCLHQCEPPQSWHGLAAAAGTCRAPLWPVREQTFPRRFKNLGSTRVRLTHPSSSHRIELPFAQFFALGGLKNSNVSTSGSWHGGGWPTFCWRFFSGVFPSYLFIVGTQQIVLGNIIVLVGVLCCVGCAWFFLIVLHCWLCLLVVLCWVCLGSSALLDVFLCAIPAVSTCLCSVGCAVQNLHNSRLRPIKLGAFRRHCQQSILEGI